MKILVEKPSPEQLEKLNVNKWPTWEAQPSIFPWHYDATEVCYILEGKVQVITPTQVVEFGKGDLVTFPEGLDCEWTVIEKISKHYQFK
jgi:uncharacterized protein